MRILGGRTPRTPPLNPPLIHPRGGSRISSWGGAHLKKIAPIGGRRENCWGISCEKSRFYAKKSFFSPGSVPASYVYSLRTRNYRRHCLGGVLTRIESWKKYQLINIIKQIRHHRGFFLYFYRVFSLNINFFYNLWTSWQRQKTFPVFVIRTINLSDIFCYQQANTGIPV